MNSDIQWLFLINTDDKIIQDPDSKIHLPEGESLNIAIAMPFLDQSVFPPPSLLLMI